MIQPQSTGRPLTSNPQEAVGGRFASRDTTMAFPIDLSSYRPVALDPARSELTSDERAQLETNIQLCRDVIIFYTAVACAKGVGGHSGGPYDTVPEVVIIRAFIENAKAGNASSGGDVLPIFFDEAGHRVATQYLLAVLRKSQKRPTNTRHQGAGTSFIHAQNLCRSFGPDSTVSSRFHFLMAPQF